MVEYAMQDIRTRLELALEEDLADHTPLEAEVSMLLSSYWLMCWCALLGSTGFSGSRVATTGEVALPACS